MSTESPFVLLEDVAKHFVVSPATVRNWLRNGTIPKDAYIKVGYIYRFDLPKLVAALTSAPKAPEQPEQLEFDFNQEDGK
jgi:hypothetical protein